MTVDLIGVVDNGTPRDLTRVPADTRRTVQAIQGATVQLRLTVYLPSGQPYSLATATVTLTIKRRPQDGATLSKTLTTTPGAPINTATATIDPADTRNLCAGRYLFDVWISQGAAREPVIPLSAFLLQPHVGAP